MHSAYIEAVGADSFGRRLKILRVARDMSAKELARESGIDRITINRLERHGSRPQRETTERLAQALDVPPEALTD